MSKLKKKVKKILVNNKRKIKVIAVHKNHQ